MIPPERDGPIDEPIPFLVQMGLSIGMIRLRAGSVRSPTVRK